jgi:sugar phosphate isomerase/epimerase
MNPTDLPSRRRFLATAASAGAAAFAAPSFAAEKAKKIRLGIDNFAVRAMGWKAPELIGYAAGLKCDTLFITDLDAFDSLEDKALAEVKKRADDAGIELLLGSWSLCPTSTSFRDNRGTADEHMALGVRASKALGSPVFRVVLGKGDDRLTEGGIDARIDDMVKVLKAGKSRAVDAGVKIAVENHAGDMHSSELVRLIEDAGSDFVGANMDSGNAMWTLETPLDNLEALGKYALTTSLRDSAIWESDNGATIQWTAMGDGDVDLKAYFARYAELCPGTAVNIETISGFNREIAYKKDSFWKAWPNGKPKTFENYVALAKKGKAREPRGANGKEAQQEFQKGDIERSIKYCREVLGLGVKA